MKYLEISGNTCKFQEIQDQKHEILENTLLKTWNTWVFFMKCKKYYEILCQKLEISGHAWKYQEIPRNSITYFYVFPFLEILPI
jgi:hypothetical protein